MKKTLFALLLQDTFDCNKHGRAMIIMHVRARDHLKTQVKHCKYILMHVRAHIKKQKHV